MIPLMNKDGLLAKNLSKFSQGWVWTSVINFPHLSKKIICKENKINIDNNVVYLKIERVVIFFLMLKFVWGIFSGGIWWISWLIIFPSRNNLSCVSSILSCGLKWASEILINFLLLNLFLSDSSMLLFPELYAPDIAIFRMSSFLNINSNASR